MTVHESAPAVARLDEEVTCVAVEPVTHDVSTWVLRRPSGGAVDFEPGQYLIVSVGIDGVAHQRCYTISSAPTQPDVAITVKRQGPVSGWLHEHLGVGGTLRVSGPFGVFSTANHPADAYLFLSAGSGITPLMSMTRALRDRGAPADVVFVHSARTPDDVVFRRELEELALLPGFGVTVLCEDDSPTEQWSGPRGRLSLRTLLTVPRLHEREVFTCGPAGYMDGVRAALDAALVDSDRCHEESFVLPDVDPVEAPAPEGGTRHTVEFRRSARRVECGSEESILNAAWRAGLRPPSMCAEGVCGTCRTGLVSGAVDMRQRGGLRQRDVDRGEILLCCSTPLADLQLDA